MSSAENDTHTGRPRIDERVVSTEHRVFGFLGPVSSCFTLAWLATHRDRLHTLILGGKRLTVLVVWDSRSDQVVPHDDAEVDAISLLTFGVPGDTPNKTHNP